MREFSVRVEEYFLQCYHGDHVLAHSPPPILRDSQKFTSVNLFPPEVELQFHLAISSLGNRFHTPEAKSDICPHVHMIANIYRNSLIKLNNLNRHVKRGNFFLQLVTISDIARSHCGRKIECGLDFILLLLYSQKRTSGNNSVDILQHFVHDTFVASCQQTCCKLFVRTCHPQACGKLF